MGGPKLGGRVLVGGYRRGGSSHVQGRIEMRVMRKWRLRWVIVFVVRLFDPVLNCHRASRTVSILAAAPISYVLVIITPNLVISVAVEDERSAASLGGNKRNS